MSQRRNRLVAAPLIAVLGLVALAGPAGASGESVGACMADHLLELVEEEHGDLGHVLHDEKVQENLEKCFEAPNPILPETNEIIWGALSFFLLFFFMVKKGFPAVKGAMDARADRIRSDLDAAEQAKIDALVESIADRRKALKSVGKRIVELEEQKEQLDDEVLDLAMEIEATKRKAVSAGALSASLTSFGDLYQEAVPGEQRELIQLRGEEAAVTAVQREATVGSPDVGFN